MRTSDTMQSSVTAAMPASLRAAVAAYQWTRDSVGESDAAVYRLRGRDGAPDLYLKHGRGSAATDLADELARLRWLAPYLPVPTVVQFARVADPEQAWLLLMALPGTTASAVLEAHPALGRVVVDALAAFLRRLHALPVSDCPFDAGHAVRLAQARQRIDAGLVDADDFDAGGKAGRRSRCGRRCSTASPVRPTSSSRMATFRWTTFCCRKAPSSAASTWDGRASPTATKTSPSSGVLSVSWTPRYSKGLLSNMGSLISIKASCIFICCWTSCSECHPPSRFFARAIAFAAA